MKKLEALNGIVYYNDGNISSKWTGMSVFRDENGYYTIRHGRKFKLRSISGAIDEFMVVE